MEKYVDLEQALRDPALVLISDVPTGRAIQFDAPHPGKELYAYQVKAVIEFLRSVGEI